MEEQAQSVDIFHNTIILAQLMIGEPHCDSEFFYLILSDFEMIQIFSDMSESGSYIHLS